MDWSASFGRCCVAGTGVTVPQGLFFLQNCYGSVQAAALSRAGGLLVSYSAS